MFKPKFFFKNYLKIVALLYFTTSCVQGILNGDYVSPDQQDEYNYVVSIRHKDFDHDYGHGFLCNGALISQKSVLTSAQCIYKYNSELNRTLSHRIYEPKQIRIVFGSVYRTRPFRSMLFRNVGKITVHSNFTGTANYDVAILHLTQPVPANAVGIAPIALRTTALGPGVQCKVSGWGEFSTLTGQRELSDYLRTAPLQVFERSDCNSIWGGTLPDRLVCMGDVVPHVCNEDLGAPVVCGRQLAGFVSRDTVCSLNRTLVTNVVPYFDWITRNGSWQVMGSYLLIMFGMVVQMIRLMGA